MKWVGAQCPPWSWPLQDPGVPEVLVRPPGPPAPPCCTSLLSCLLPLSPPLMFHYVHTTPFVTGPTILEYWVPFSSFDFSHCTSAWEESTDMSSGSLILSLGVCWSSVYWWVNQSHLHFWYNVFDFQHFLLILRVSIFLLILPIYSCILFAFLLEPLAY